MAETTKPAKRLDAERTPPAGTYGVYINCQNCGLGERSATRAEVPKGTPLEQAKCPDCECVSLVRRP